MEPENKINETDGIIMICEKGDNKMKLRMMDFVKMGFGFYVGYNLADFLRNSVKLNIKTK